MTNTKENKSAKNKQIFPGVDVGTPKVPIRKSKSQKQQGESLSDWEHAS